MSSGHFDPNNHVSEVSLGDNWDDLDCDFETPHRVTVLPPKRKTAEDDNDGVGNAPNVPHGGGAEAGGEDGDPSNLHRLEVQEITGKVVRLGAPVKSAKSERTIVFRERGVRKKGARNQRGEDVRWGAGKRHSKYWLSWMGIGVVTAVVTGLLLLPQINSTNENSPVASGVFTVVDDVKIENLGILNALVAQQTEALRLFRKYSMASRPDDFLPIIRDSAQLHSLIQATWRPAGIGSRREPSANSEWQVMDLVGRPFAILSGTFPDQTHFDAYFLSKQGQLILDWKATTGYSSASFAQLEKGIGNGSEVRGTVSAAETYSAVFPENVYQSYRFTSADGNISVWCYARRGDPAETQISPLIQAGDILQEAQPSQRVTLHLDRGPNGSRPNQWVVTEMLHIDWVAP